MSSDVWCRVLAEKLYTFYCIDIWSKKSLRTPNFALWCLKADLYLCQLGLASSQKGLGFKQVAMKAPNRNDMFFICASVYVIACVNVFSLVG